MGIQFHQTGYGSRFFNSQLPSLIDQIRDLTTAINFKARVDVMKLVRDIGQANTIDLVGQAREVEAVLKAPASTKE